MKTIRNIFSLLLLALILTSCAITDYTRTMELEIMKPGIFNIPEELNTVAILNRDPYHHDSIPFRFFNGNTISTDTIIKYKELSNTCVDALTGFFNKEGYFKNVINYRDSLSYLFPSKQPIINPEEMFQKTKSDICIFLDFFNFSISKLNGLGDVVVNNASLAWTIAFKTDTLSYLYNQKDTLIFDDYDFSLNLSSQKRLNMLVNNSAEYLGRYFGSRIIPSWLTVERIYYKSSNQNMLLAEKYALNNQWIKAAEIWNKQTKNKNSKMAAKASYNMALACEMEGKLDVAVDWLIKSYSILNQNNEEHKANCQRYIGLIVLRKMEIEKLGKQVRN